MSTREFFLQMRAAEYPTTLRVYRALPAGRLDYRPEPRARSARELVNHMIYYDRMGAELLGTARIDYREPPPPATLEELIAACETANQEFVACLRRSSAAAWEKKAVFQREGDQVETTVSNILWTFHFALIHHRGQLSTYIRPMGGRVPSIYGPSGDDAGA